MPDFALTGSGSGKGKTKHRISSNKKRTVKAASTYGEAYRKYVKMYGGKTEPSEPNNAETDNNGKLVVGKEEEKKGFFQSIADKIGLGSKSDNTNSEEDAEKEKAEGEKEKAEGEKEKVEGEKEKAEGEKEKVEGEKEKVEGNDEVKEEGEQAEKEKEEGDSPFSSIKNALSDAEETIAGQKDKLEKNIEEGKETLTAATNDTVSELANGVKNTTQRVSSNIINSVSKLTPGSTSSTPLIGDDETTETNDQDQGQGQNQPTRNAAITTLAGEAVGTSMSAAERALESMKDALKAFQLALAAVETVIGATKASVVANSAIERMTTAPSRPLSEEGLSPSTPSSLPSVMDMDDSNDASLKEMNSSSPDSIPESK
jgi:hypothetical protein